MTFLEAIRQTTESIKIWVEGKFLKKDEVTADDFGVYVQDIEPTDVVDGDIWIDTANDPMLKIRKNGEWVEVWGATSGGGSGVGASAPKLTTMTMLASEWQGTNDVYSQIVTCSNINANSKLDLQPTPNQIIELQDAEISLMLTNTNGVVTAWAIAGKPTVDMTMSVLITEVAIV